MAHPDIKFQSTLPVRGATKARRAAEDEYFISIHAPREGSDRNLGKLCLWQGQFQSTLPVRGATLSILINGGNSDISIHAPREGSDSLCQALLQELFDFNPRSP